MSLPVAPVIINRLQLIHLREEPVTYVSWEPMSLLVQPVTTNRLQLIHLRDLQVVCDFLEPI